jgi:hypothetical protein
MRVRLHPDVAKLVNKSRKKNANRSANQEVNIALTAYYLQLSVAAESRQHR